MRYFFFVPGTNYMIIKLIYFSNVYVCVYKISHAVDSSISLPIGKTFRSQLCSDSFN